MVHFPMKFAHTPKYILDNYDLLVTGVDFKECIRRIDRSVRSGRKHLAQFLNSAEIAEYVHLGFSLSDAEFSWMPIEE
jgi:hypothetical protein